MTLPQFFPDLDIIGEQPPAIHGQFKHCESSRRTARRFPGCPLLAECRENQRKGGAACCETLFVAMCGGQEVTL